MTTTPAPRYSKMTPGTFSEWLQARGYSDQTVEQRVGFHRSRVDDWGTMLIHQHAIAGWLSQYDGWTHRTYHAHLTSIYDWLVETEQLEVNPVRGIRNVPCPRPRPRPLEERDLMLALSKGKPKTRAFILLGYLAGLRAHEIAKFHGCDITETQVRVVGKGGVLDFVPTHPVLWQLARAYPRDGYWFPSPHSARAHVTRSCVTANVGSLFRSLRIAGATHRARHTYGTQLLRGGANLRVVQDLMRHRSLATTALYLGVDEVERRAAVLGLVA